jgi:hypothetical protein
LRQCVSHLITLPGLIVTAHNGHFHT